MMHRRRREKAMLATVRRLRRLLRKADLATKVVRVMRMEIFYMGNRRAEVGGQIAEVVRCAATTEAFR
jgi:hypothetical protein